MTRAQPEKPQETTTMETIKFDGIAKSLSTTSTRRSAVRGLVAGALAAVAGGALLHAEDVSAKRRRKKGKKSNQPSTSKRRQPGAFCDFDAQCQTDQGYLCAVAVNAGNSDRTCAGGPGAFCGPKTEDEDDTAPFCAVGHACVNSHCQAVPDDL
jgi:hypothetical protein